MNYPFTSKSLKNIGTYFYQLPKSLWQVRFNSYKQWLSYVIRILHFFSNVWKFDSSDSQIHCSRQCVYSWQNIILLRDTPACQTLEFLTLFMSCWFIKMTLCNTVRYRTVHSSRVLCVGEFYCQDKKIVTMETNFISSRGLEQYRRASCLHRTTLQ